MTTTVDQTEQVPGRRSLKHDTVWSFLATGTRTVGAIVVFFMLARYLEERQYGLYAAALALFLLLGAFVTLGTSHIVVKRVSSDRSLAQSSWGAALLPGVALALGWSGLLAILGDLAVPRMGAQAILLLAMAEFLGVAIGVPAASALQALDRFPQSALLTILWTSLRVVFVSVVFFVLDEPTLVAVGWALLAASLSAGWVSSLVLASVVGRPKFSIAESKQICREGFPFSLTQVSGIVLGDIDKQMLVRTTNGDFLTGVYSAGNRVLGLSATPVYAVLAATYPRFFAKGAQDGLRGTWKYARTLMLPVAAYAAAAGAALFRSCPFGRRRAGRRLCRLHQRDPLDGGDPVHTSAWATSRRGAHRCRIPEHKEPVHHRRWSPECGSQPGAHRPVRNRWGHRGHLLQRDLPSRWPDHLDPQPSHSPGKNPCLNLARSPDPERLLNRMSPRSYHPLSG